VLDSSDSGTRSSEGLKVAVIGAGAIGGAVALALADARYCVTATRRRVERIRHFEERGIWVTSDNVAAADWADLVILAIKPHKAARVASEISEAVRGKLLISLAAAVSTSTLSKAAPGARIVRAMPNLAVSVRESFTAFCRGPGVTDEDVKLVRELFGCMGTCEEVHEELMDAVTGLSGSGPAYAALFIEALMYAGLKVGLPRDVALKSAAQTMLGAAKMVLEQGIHPAQLKEMVVTPGGTTIEGIFYIEEGGVRSSVMKAVEAATERAKTLSRVINGQSQP